MKQIKAIKIAAENGKVSDVTIKNTVDSIADSITGDLGNDLMERLVEDEIECNPDDYDEECAEMVIIARKLNDFIKENDANYVSHNSELIDDFLVNYHKDDGLGESNYWKYFEELRERMYESEGYDELSFIIQDIMKEEKTEEAIDEFYELGLEERLCFFLILKDLKIKPTEELYQKYCNFGEDKTDFIRELNNNSSLNS